MRLSSGLSDYAIKSQEVSGVGSVRECNYRECTNARDSVADGDMADTLQAEQKGCESSVTHHAYPPDTPAI